MRIDAHKARAGSKPSGFNFAEDTAILTARGSVLARPGAPSRRDEVASIGHVIANFFPSLHAIQSPGTLTAGDVCEAGNHFFIGHLEAHKRSGRTAVG